MKELIQIAGIMDRAEADLLLSCGVQSLGFPLRLPVHTVDLSEAEAGRIIRSLDPPAQGVLITYLSQAEEIRAFCRALGAFWVQLHGEISIPELQKLKAGAPDLTVIKSLIVHEDNVQNLEALVQAAAPHVDAFFTDTFDPATGASGATGKTHDWQVSRRLVELSPCPVILAGGLTPENVKQAILEVGPAGVDAHTGVEGPDGRKNRARVEAFVAEARAGFADRNAGGHS